jgi:hypothetical protein
MIKPGALLFAVLLVATASIARAEYVLELKNGREITVPSYRDEGSMIKFPGFGGEISLQKDQIRRIRRANEHSGAARPGLVLDPAAPAGDPRPTAPPVAKPGSPEPAAQVEQQRSEQEKKYQERVKEITQELKGLRERYGLLTRGNRGPEPTFFTTEEAFRGHQEDLLSRLRDAQLKSQGLPRGSDASSPQFSLDAPPAYSDKQKELSDLRSRIAELEKRREHLIDETKAKNFDTAGLFLD